MENTIVTITEASVRLGKKGNRKLIRDLIKMNKIPTGQIGMCKTIDAKGFSRLKKAVKEWDSRPRLSPKPSKSKAVAQS